MEILRVEDLSFSYPGSDKSAVDGVTFSVETGEFIVICGESGCGKTTLLKLIKREISPAGSMSGRIFYCGQPVEEVDGKITASEIGYVFQDPDSQIVTDKVWHELAFGLENMGLPTDVIRRRVGEMASYFGIESWFRNSTDKLSGGQKQLLDLASVMVMQPKMLLLDEPTGQLDPIAASDFISTLHKLNRELGLTIILAEHRLEEVFPIADRIMIMDGGKCAVLDTPENAGAKLREFDGNHPMLRGLPAAVRIYNALGEGGNCPVTVREGRNYLEERFVPEKASEGQEYSHSEIIAAELKKVWFRYERELPDVLTGASLKVFKGEFYCILGGNGTGKTTLLDLLAGLNKAYRGKVEISGKKIADYKGNSLYRKKLAYLPQDPLTVFLTGKVEEDYLKILEAMEIPKSQRREMINEVSEKLGIRELLERHPYDLSGGEKQKCAIGKMLLTQPEILLLDEPTKGLDACSKERLGETLSRLAAEGMTVIAVTHDIEFAAENADRCAMLFDGGIISEGVPREFFSENNFYTTSANRIARRLWKNAVTCSQVIEKCRKGERRK